MFLPVEVEALHLEPLPEPGDQVQGMGEFGVGDVPLLQGAQGVVQGTGLVQPRQDQGLGAVRDGQLLVLGQCPETYGQGEDRLGLLLHGDEEVGVHLRPEPV